ncbi:LysR family transcriptional regulator [Kiloniella litopenaei]|uniref:LysR family transcriptional regulator n=1 Tax=Kiloniella litopenaei TaxID=1549748 RepID=UPI000697E4E2|nr:LysR family transcriptional regulator [Kiloniella litopenaei]
MDLSALRTFKLVMDLGSVTAAAENLNTVQPNVTARIRKLENELGVSLFLRAHRRLVPTHEAEKLLEYANAMLTLERAAKGAVNPGDAGHIRMGFVDTQASHLLPRFITEYRRFHPDAEISVDTGVSGFLNRAVDECRLDAAVVVDRRKRSTDQDSLTTHMLFTEPLVYIAPQGLTRLEQALELPIMVLIQEGCGYRNFAIDWYRAQNLTAPKMMEISTLDGILACIKAGLCASVLPRSIVESFELENRAAVFPLKGDNAEIKIALVHRPEFNGDHRINLLLEMFRRDESVAAE